MINMNPLVLRKLAIPVILGGISFCGFSALSQPAKTEINFEPFVWSSDPPEDCPFEQSDDIPGILFTGKSSDYRVADTWYFSWARMINYIHLIRMDRSHDLMEVKMNQYLGNIHLLQDRP